MLHNCADIDALISQTTQPIDAWDHVYLSKSTGMPVLRAEYRRYSGSSDIPLSSYDDLCAAEAMLGELQDLMRVRHDHRRRTL